MGFLINILRNLIEKLAGDTPFFLRLGGFFIAFILVFTSGFFGWLIERLTFPSSPIPQWIGCLVMIIALASALAAGSLRGSVLGVLDALPRSSGYRTFELARKKLGLIVGRQVNHLDESEIIRAAAETASENAVDGVFAPLFWMFLGIILWNFSDTLPGPLALAWSFKAASTIDSMLGYRRGRLRWLGSAGARLDDLLTWLPCRLVLITLPLVSKPLKLFPQIIYLAWRDGSRDESPNSGLSEAIFATCADVQMGGENRYLNKTIIKPKLAIHAPKADREGVERLLLIGLKLEFAWLLFGAIGCFTI